MLRKDLFLRSPQYCRNKPMVWGIILFSYFYGLKIHVVFHILPHPWLFKDKDLAQSALGDFPNHLLSVTVAVLGLFLWFLCDLSVQHGCPSAVRKVLSCRACDLGSECMRDGGAPWLWQQSDKGSGWESLEAIRAVFTSSSISRHFHLQLFFYLYVSLLQYLKYQQAFGGSCRWVCELCCSTRGKFRACSHLCWHTARSCGEQEVSWLGQSFAWAEITLGSLWSSTDNNTTTDYFTGVSTAGSYRCPFPACKTLLLMSDVVCLLHSQAISFLQTFSWKRDAPGLFPAFPSDH